MKRAAGSKFLKRLWADEQGQSTIEYILILAFAVVGAGAIASGVVKSIDSGILTLGGQLELDLKTGRITDDVYTVGTP
jgi:Flp pilus assembly pilin Flp